MSLDLRLRDARAWAIDAHGDQRYGREPYVVHLDEAMHIGLEFGLDDEDVLVSTLLHDVIEDTPRTFHDVQRRFGTRVATLVDAVTDPPGHPNRKTRKAAAYPRIRAVVGATDLKLCDRLANVRASTRTTSHLLEMYRKEHPDFVAALRAPALPPHTEALWDAVNALLRG